MRYPFLFLFLFLPLFALCQSEFAAKLPIDESLVEYIGRISRPYFITMWKGEKIIFYKRDALTYTSETETWSSIMTFPFEIGNAANFKGKLIVSDQSLDKRYEVNLDQKELVDIALPTKLFDLASNPIKQVSFEIGSQDCFFSKQQRTYSRQGDDFVLSYSDSAFLDNMSARINHQVIDQLVLEFDQSRFTMPSIQDLNIGPEDIAAYKAFFSKDEGSIDSNLGKVYYGLRRWYPDEEPSFDYYFSIADSILRTPDSVINQVFLQEYGNWSTGRNWHTVILEFQDGKKLKIENHDQRPNYFYVPWTVDYDGLLFKSSSLKVSQHIERLTRGDFFYSPNIHLHNLYIDKTYAIFLIADHIFRTKRSK